MKLVEIISSEKTDLKKLISECVLLIGGVLIPGAEAPKLVTKVGLLKSVSTKFVIKVVLYNKVSPLL